MVYQELAIVAKPVRITRLSSVETDQGELGEDNDWCGRSFEFLFKFSTCFSVP
jgi:hypothetical protein